MKRISLNTRLSLGLVISFVGFLGAQMGQPARPTGPAMGGISRAEIEQVLNSDDFKNLSKMMGIPIETMSDAEKNALIEETEQFAHQMEQLPPQEQEKKMQEIFSQITEQPQQPPVEPKKPVEPQKAEKKQEKESPKVSHHKVESNKKITRKLAENLEKVELKFSSMLQASPDTLLEHDWAGITANLPWAISALRRMSNNDKLLEHLSSDEFRVLEGQISDTYKELKPLNKKFKTPDVAKLRQVAGVDASRAQLVNDEEKEISKKAATGIIKLLSGNIPSVKFGIKGMLERYDKATLAELEKLSKQPKTATTPEKKGSMYRADGSHGAGRSSSSSPSSSYYDPYERSYGGYQEPYGSRAGRSGSGSGESSPLYGPAGKEKNKDEKTGTAEDKKGRSGIEAGDGIEKEKSLKPKDKRTDEYNKCSEEAAIMEKEAKTLLEKHEARLKALDPDAHTAGEINDALGKVRNSQIPLHASISKLMRATNKELQDTQKDKLFELLKGKSNLMKLANIAKSANSTAPQNQGALVQSSLKEFASKHAEIIKDIQTPKVALEELKKDAEALGKFIGDNRLASEVDKQAIARKPEFAQGLMNLNALMARAKELKASKDIIPAPINALKEKLKTKHEGTELVTAIETLE